MENIKDLIAECSKALFSFEVADNDQLKVGFDSEQPDPALIQRITNNKEYIIY